jgi:epoxyqueuosine reductase
MRVHLDAGGLNIYSVTRLTKLPESVQEAILSSAKFSADTDPRVILVGHHGANLWQFVSPSQPSKTNPIDDYSRSLAEQALQKYLSEFENRLLFPDGIDLPLQQLGMACGWGEPSWLGINIYNQFGTWYAFRAVIVTTAPLPTERLPNADSPCVECPRPCKTVCPVSAPSTPGQFDLNACIGFRLQQDSPCANQCLARNACPIATQNRYPRDMTNYFYARSLITLQRWALDND